jgi:hypothetical protein
MTEGDMAIEPPIVASEGTDLWFYDTVVAAERDLEATDVREGVYEVFDSRGRPLDLTIERREKPSALLGPTHVDFVRLRARTSAQPAPDYVRNKILQYCARVSLSGEAPVEASLPDLLRWAQSRFGA